MPSSARYYALVAQARLKGINARAAAGYAALMWWGEHYELPAARIVSGKRDRGWTVAAQKRWDRGDRAGLVTRPATNSAHLSGEAFDLERVGHLWIYGEWAPYAGLRWGGRFRSPDPVHFDTRT